MPIFLQPVELSQRCLLGEVLLWVAFQRLPVARYDFDEERDVPDPTKAYGLEADRPEPLITDEEAKRANIPPDPRFRALIEGRSPMPPSFYDGLMGEYDSEPEEKTQLLEERAAAEILQRAFDDWKPHYSRAIEYAVSRIFVALRSGQLASTGRLLPGRTLDEAREAMDRDNKGVLDFPETSVLPSFWRPGIYFKASTAENGSSCYGHLACNTADVLAIFPGERESFVVERIGDSVIINDAEQKPTMYRRRGRPAYPWEPFHVEVAALLQRGELPAKKEAAIQHFQTWFETTLGEKPSRAAIGEKLKLYYDRFGVRDGQKIR
jgi:hypothetical protein